MKVVGIDVGLDGGIAVLRVGHEETMHATAFPMPVLGGKGKRCINETGLKSMLAGLGDIGMVFVERAHPMPKQGASSGFNFGVTYGLICGIVVGLGIPYTVVSAVTWQKVMLAGTPGTDTKQRSIMAACRLFPTLDLRATERCRKLHDGMADALLIAEYGRRMLNGGK